MEQPLTGGSEDKPEPRSAGQRDHDRIRQGLDEAERDGRPIDDATARLIAMQLYGGQHSPLHLLASRGAIRESEHPDIGFGVRSLADELAECRRYFGEAIEPWVQAIEAYAASREDKGPVDGWARATEDQMSGRALERSGITSPRIYVASLADYNNGVLHGRWIDADQDPDEIRAEVQALLADSREPVAEDWAIHDHEGFGPFSVGEYESLDTVSAVALGIAECGLAFAAYVSWAGTSKEALSQFDACFLGYWPDLEAYARHVADDLEWHHELQKLPEGMQAYVDIDYARLARDLDTEVITVAGGGIFVFRQQ